jgi:flagellar hook-associated protein 1 FlgK
MGISQALNAAIDGLNVNQSQIALVAANVANAGTAGYVSKSATQVAVAGNGPGIGVRISTIQREYDSYVQGQMWTENAGASYATTRSNMLNQLQDVYGTPGSDASLETVYNNFTSALQALSSSPDDPSAQNQVVNTAQLLAQQLNQMSSGIQGLRENAETGISDAVTQANNDMSQIAKLNTQLAASTANDSATATMEDQRDNYVNDLSQLMDVKVIQGNNNQVQVFTNSGVQLVGTSAATLSFDAQGTMTPNTVWTSDPSTRGVGTITLTSPNGSTVDLVQSNAIRSGTIAADLQLRDTDLVQAQGQLDAIAANMSSALSDQTTQGQAVTAGAQSGFDVDLSSLSAGNKITIDYTDPRTNTAHTITLVRVDDPSVLPLPDSTTNSPNDKVYGIDFSGGITAAYGEIASAIGSTGMVASNPTGTTLRILNDGPGNAVTVNSVSTTTTATSLQGGSSQISLFTDGASNYTGAVTPAGAQSVGYAARITVNSQIAADPSSLEQYASNTTSGDSTRPNFLYQQMTGSSLLFPPSAGIGTAATPFSGSISAYVQQMISVQGQTADTASSLQQGQAVVLNSLQQRYNDSANVNIDTEMANLIQLQNSYAANARVMSAVRDMINTLLQM